MVLRNRFGPAGFKGLCAAALMVVLASCAPASAGERPRASAAVQQDSVCVFEYGRARLVAAAEAGEMSHEGTAPGRWVYPRVPPPYGDSLDWAIHFLGGRLRRYGDGPRLILPWEHHAVGTHEGVTVFAEVAATAPPYDVVFVPIAPGCEYLLYTHLEPTTGPVRPRR